MKWVMEWVMNIMNWVINYVINRVMNSVMNWFIMNQVMGGMILFRWSWSTSTWFCRTAAGLMWPAWTRPSTPSRDLPENVAGLAKLNLPKMIFINIALDCRFLHISFFATQVIHSAKDLHDVGTEDDNESVVSMDENTKLLTYSDNITNPAGNVKFHVRAPFRRSGRD